MFSKEYLSTKFLSTFSKTVQYSVLLGLLCDILFATANSLERIFAAFIRVLSILTLEDKPNFALSLFNLSTKY